MTGFIMRRPRSKPDQVKLIIFNCPVEIDKLKILRLLAESNQSLDSFGIMLIDIFKNYHEIHLQKTIFYREMDLVYQAVSSFLDYSYLELFQQTEYFLLSVERLLLDYRLYHQHRLPFNSAWIENPNILSFYRTDKDDIPDYTPSQIYRRFQSIRG